MMNRLNSFANYSYNSSYGARRAPQQQKPQQLAQPVITNVLNQSRGAAAPVAQPRTYWGASAWSNASSVRGLPSQYQYQPAETPQNNGKPVVAPKVMQNKNAPTSPTEGDGQAPKTTNTDPTNPTKDDGQELPSSWSNPAWLQLLYGQYRTAQRRYDKQGKTYWTPLLKTAQSATYTMDQKDSIFTAATGKKITATVNFTATNSNDVAAFGFGKKGTIEEESSNENYNFSDRSITCNNAEGPLDYCNFAANMGSGDDTVVTSFHVGWGNKFNLVGGTGLDTLHLDREHLEITLKKIPPAAGQPQTQFKDKNENVYTVSEFERVIIGSKTYTMAEFWKAIG